MGEYVSACIAGVFSLEDGLKLISARARLMQSLPENGKMVVIFAGEKLVAGAIEPYAGEVSVAAINGPENTVISGLRRSVDEIASCLEKEGVKFFELAISHASTRRLWNRCWLNSEKSPQKFDTPLREHPCLECHGLSGNRIDIHTRLLVHGMCAGRSGSQTA